MKLNRYPLRVKFVVLVLLLLTLATFLIGLASNLAISRYLTGADNVSLRGTRHFDLPRNERTFTSLYNGIASATNEAGVVVAKPPTPAATGTEAGPPGTRPVILGANGR